MYFDLDSHRIVLVLHERSSLTKYTAHSIQVSMHPVKIINHKLTISENPDQNVCKPIWTNVGTDRLLMNPIHPVLQSDLC